MATKILVINRNIDFTFKKMRYEWPLSEQMACCQLYIKEKMPNAEVTILADEVLSLRKLVTRYKSATILIPSRLIFGSEIDVANNSVAVLRQIGFNVIEAIPNAKLTGIPEDNSHLVIAGDSKITSYCSLCSSANTNIPLKLIMDSMTQHFQVDETILTDLYLVPTGLMYSPKFKGLIERFFTINNLSTKRFLSNLSSNQALDEDSSNSDVDPDVDEE